MRNPIRSCFCFLAFACISSLVAFAEASSVSSAPSAFAAYPPGVSGDYVVYRDYSWKEPTWVGFLRYDDSTWGAFVKTPSVSSDVRVLFRAELSDGELVLTGQKIVSNISQADVLAVNYLMGTLPDLVSWRNIAAREGSILPSSADVPGSARLASGAGRSDLLPPCVSLARDRAEFGGAVSLLFAPEVPVFNLASMRNASGGQMLELVRAGRVRSGGDEAFFGFVSPGPVKAGSALSVPANRKVERRTVDGVELALDGQWTMVADNTFFLGNSAVVIVDTLDLGLMQIPRDGLALSLLRLFSLSSESSWVSPSSFALSGKASRFRIESTAYDVESGTQNRDIKLCVPSVDGKRCAVVSLTVNETAYRANKAYFDALF